MIVSKKIFYTIIKNMNKEAKRCYKYSSRNMIRIRKTLEKNREL